MIAAGCGGGGSSGTAASSGSSGGAAQGGSSATVTVRHTDDGMVLADGQGRTLYMFDKDKGGMSACDGACAAVWPPLTTGATPHAAGGAVADKLGTAKRGDGRLEVTYAGRPLYTYVGDSQPGQARGQGLDQFGAKWYVLSRSGKEVDDD
jgi:predicted lipoprotein with Yx(FWY)xxD motif